MDDLQGFVLVGFFSRKGHCGVMRHKAGVGRQADLGCTIQYSVDSSVVQFLSKWSNLNLTC